MSTIAGQENLGRVAYFLTQDSATTNPQSTAAGGGVDINPKSLVKAAGMLATS